MQSHAEARTQEIAEIDDTRDEEDEAEIPESHEGPELRGELFTLIIFNSQDHIRKLQINIIEAQHCNCCKAGSTSNSVGARSSSGNSAASSPLSRCTQSGAGALARVLGSSKRACL